jgi:hypothetical protein
MLVQRVEGRFNIQTNLDGLQKLHELFLIHIECGYRVTREFMVVLLRPLLDKSAHLIMEVKIRHKLTDFGP